MPTLVDGHNLIGRLRGISLAQADDEEQLVMLLRRYATRRRGGKVVVVFDHGVYGHPGTLNGYGVEVHFARSPQDADTQLLKRLHAIKRPAEWMLVSSDRAITGAARSRGVRVVSSEEFARRLEQPDPVTPTGDKRDVKLSPAELDEWLRAFGEDPTVEQSGS